jgi:hypothetical protein
MKRTSKMLKYQDDKFIARWYDRDSGKIYYQRKRLPNSATEFCKRLQKAYIKSSAYATKVAKDELELSLKEAFHLVCYARGEDRGTWSKEDTKKLLGY